MSTNLTSKDILLLLLYVPGATGQRQEAIRGRSRLQKMMFLFGNEVYKRCQFDRLMSEKDLPVFVPMPFGPYSGQVFDDVSFLWNLGFIEVQPVTGNEASEEEEGDDYSYWLHENGLDDIDATMPLEVESCSLTKLGANFVQDRLLPSLSKSQLNALEMFKKNCTRVTLGELLQYISIKYRWIHSEERTKSTRQ